MNAPMLIGTARRRGPSGTIASLVLAAVLAAVWTAAYPRVPDMAAQVYRVHLFATEGLAVWDSRWYGGHDLLGYSLISPALGALIGLRALGVLAVLASTALFAALMRLLYGHRAAWGACLFAVGAVGDVWSGRVTFALGVAFGLGAVLGLALIQASAGSGSKLAGGRIRGGAALVLTGILSGLCAAASPVAGALLALTGVAWWLSAGLSGRPARVPAGRRRRAWPMSPGLLVGPGALVLVAMQLLFPEGGVEPFPVLSFAVTALVAVGFIWAVGRGQPGLRIGAGLYLLAVLLSLLIPSPMGSNCERYGVLLAGPLLVGVLCSASPPARRAGRALAVLVACGASVWVVWGPVRETRAVAGDPATRAAYYRPVERFLAGHGGELVRVEVPFTRSHWEAALLAPSVSLARGWEKQLDTRYDEVLLKPGLTAASYHAWLRREAVAYVALPDVRPDPSSAQESRLIRSGLPYLRLVFRSAHWRIYRVLATRALVSGPGRLEGLGQDSFRVRASGPGKLLVRVRYSRYLTVTAGEGCVRRGPEGWTQVQVGGSTRITVAARFSVARALGLAGDCRGMG